MIIQILINQWLNFGGGQIDRCESYYKFIRYCLVTVGRDVHLQFNDTLSGYG